MTKSSHHEFAVRVIREKLKVLIDERTRLNSELSLKTTALSNVHNSIADLEASIKVLADG
jgi:hypothetical protein